jgi:galactokinase
MSTSEELRESESADITETLSVFAAQFGGRPDVIASSAARVNLVGEHTDYNGGEVLPIAIARRTYVAVRARAGDSWRAASQTQRDVGEFSGTAPARSGSWWDYVAGVVAKLREGGVTLPACDIAVCSDVPAGAGLSSSAALEVAAAVALTSLVGAPGDLRELALLSQRAEVEFVGVNSGIMDQFASALGREAHALHVWCDRAEYEHVPMRDAVLIFDTGVPRSLRGSAYNERRAECEQALTLLRSIEPELPTLAAASPELVRRAGLPDVLMRRALHVSEETRRVQTMVDALRRGGQPSGELLLASHASLRDNYECSTPELDWFVERAMACDGVRGARLTGAGWGGCAIALGALDALEAAAPEITRDYVARFPHEPRAWLTHAEAGARVDLGRE